jgi:hypothetical protein
MFNKVDASNNLDKVQGDHRTLKEIFNPLSATKMFQT